MRPPVMTRRRVYRWETGALLVLVLGFVFFRGSLAGGILTLGGLGVLAGVSGLLILPWLGPFRRVRVRYHTPAWTEAQAVALGRSLDTLARATEHGVTLIWRREAGELRWAVEVAAPGEAALRRILAHLLPDLVLEPAPAWPPLAATGLYRWPGSAAGRGGSADPFDIAALRESTVLQGDFEIRIRMVAGGGVILAQGTPGPEAGVAGIRLLWRALWSFLGPVGPGASDGNRARRVPFGAGILWAFHHYPLVEAWAGASPALCVPAAGLPGTAGLDTHTSLHIPLPPAYDPPDSDQKGLRLGRSTLDGKILALPCGPSSPVPAIWRQHFFALGADRGMRQAVVTSLMAQALAKGATVLHLDPSGEIGAQLVGQPPLAGMGRPLWSDLENPGGSVHLNLLAVPVSGPDRAIGEATALALALEEHLPVLASYLRLLGVRSGGDGTFLLNWTRILLLRHHRDRLVAADHAPVSPIETPAPVPDLPMLYAALDDPESLRGLVAEEVAAWTTPEGALASTLGAAGASGRQAAALARATLEEVRAHLDAQTRGERRLTAANLRTRLGPAVDHLGLFHLWRGAVPPAALFDTTPGPLWLTRLPVKKVRESDATAARWYGYYLLASAIAVAQARVRQGQSGPPVLLVLEDTRAWASGGLLQAALPQLGQAGFAVLMTSADLPGAPDGTRLLHGAATWWIGRVDAADGQRMQAELLAQGQSADLPLASLPSHMAICKTLTPAGPLVATVNPDGSPKNQMGASPIEASPVPVPATPRA